MMIPTLLAQIPEFETVESLLDVGVGVGLLAVSAASAWPGAKIVGLDVWEPALERARANVSAAGLEDRITLRNQDLTALDDIDRYDCAWLPTFFLSDATLANAMPNVVRAVAPNGWIVLGLFRQPPNALGQATMALRTIRSGGAELDPKRAAEILDAAGCASVRSIEPGGSGPITFVIGQKPA